MRIVGLTLDKADEIKTSLEKKKSRKADKKKKGPRKGRIVGLSLGKAYEIIKTSLTKIYRKADKKKKGPRKGRIVGLSLCMAHEIVVSSAFLYYGWRNLYFVPRVFSVSSAKAFFLVVWVL